MYYRVVYTRWSISDEPPRGEFCLGKKYTRWLVGDGTPCIDLTADIEKNDLMITCSNLI